MAQRAQYLGLYAPTKVQMEAVVYDAGTIESEVQRLTRLLVSADSGEQGALGSAASETGTTSD